MAIRLSGSEFAPFWANVLDKYAQDVHPGRSWQELLTTGNRPSSYFGNSPTPTSINGKRTLSAAIGEHPACKGEISGRTLDDYHKRQKEPLASYDADKLDTLAHYLGHASFQDYRDSIRPPQPAPTPVPNPTPPAQPPSSGVARWVMGLLALTTLLSTGLAIWWFTKAEEANESVLIKGGVPYQEGMMKRLEGVWISYNRGNVPRTIATQTSTNPQGLLPCNEPNRYHRMVWELAEQHNRLWIRRKGLGSKADSLNEVKFEGVLTHISDDGNRIDFLLKQVGKPGLSGARHYMCVNNDNQSMNCVCTSYSYSGGDKPIVLRELMIRQPTGASYDKEDPSPCFPNTKVDGKWQRDLRNLNWWLTARPDDLDTLKSLQKQQ